MQREAVVGSRYSDRENSTTDVNTQGLLTTVLQRMGKLEDTLAEARHMPSPSPIVGFGNYQEGHAHSQMNATPIDCNTTPCSQCGRSEPHLNEEELSRISMVVGESTKGVECTMRKLQL